MSSSTWMKSLALLLLLSGCAVPATVRKEPPVPKPPEAMPPPAEPPVVVKPAPRAEDPFAVFPEIFRGKAQSEERQGNLRMALLHWGVVRAFLPEDPEASGRVTALEREIRSVADGHLRQGKEKYREMKYEDARREFVAALTYDPFLEEAADYLKHRLARPDSRTYVTKEGDTPKSVAREIYNDPGKDFLVAYFNGLDAGASMRPGTRLTLPLLDIPMAGTARGPVPAQPPVYVPAPARPPARPAYPDDSLEKARASFRAGEYQKAAALAEQALERSPASREARDLRNAAYYQLGTDYLRKQEYANSLRMFRRVDASYRDQKDMVARVESRLRREAERHYAAGLKRFLAEDLEGAVQEWETTLKLDPAHPKAKKDMERARRMLEQVRTMQ